MANFNDMAMLFATNNVEEHENHNIYHERQTRNKDNVPDPFTLSDRLFVKNFRLLKDVVKELIDLLRPHIVSNNRSSAINLNNKVSTQSLFYLKAILFYFFLISVNFLLLYIVTNYDLFII